MDAISAMKPIPFRGLCVACVGLFVAGVLPPAALEGAASDPQKETVEIFSRLHTVDRVIPSMEGEPDEEPFFLEKTDAPELLWVTAGKVSVVDAQTSSTQPPEMLCHSHLMFPFWNF